MLAVFEKATGNPPEELRLPSVGLDSDGKGTREEILQTFRLLWPESTFYHLSNGNFMTLSHGAQSPLHPRMYQQDREGSIQLKWGMAGDGSLVLSDDPNTIEKACGKSSASFPPGCIFMNGNGLISIDHPLHKVKAIACQDDDGKICGVMFQVDLFTRLQSIPRNGSAANWADTAIVEGD
uniref:DUF3700 domain-containing protein n=1 Tax=Gossypium raimondii TaxID=29730 RepID=A0A0D2VHG7_GOSRA|nr:hypothetical protein B456_011G027000 [Gossypium raimondii]